MSEAANLSVSITGDASGLINAAASAQSALAALQSAAAGLCGEFGNKELKISLNAVDNTAAGVSSARANINSLQDKTVTISVKYNIGKIPTLASGTKNAKEGLAVVNDEKGISDPRELIEHNGRLIMFGGSDVIVPLSGGDKVYTADETKAIMSGMGLPHYASGKNNELYQSEKTELTHYKKTHDVSMEEELQRWIELMNEFSYDSEVAMEIEENIYALQQKINKETADKEKDALETALEDYKKSSDAWIKYQVQINDMSVDEQIAAYKRQLENYNAMVSDMTASAVYSADEIKEIWSDFYEYKSDMDLKIGKLEKEQSYAVYQKWQSDAENWKNIRDTYDDWYEAGDSPVKFYERSIERIQQMYDGGYVDWQEYRDDIMDAVLKLYEAKMDDVETLLSYQEDYIKNLKAKFSKEEQLLEDKWDSSDRAASMADVSGQLEIYENAVTQKGLDKYKSLQEEMKKLRREEEMYTLQKSHTETLNEIEESFDIVEANKKYLLSAIEESGINIEGIVGSVNTDIQSMENTITYLFNKTISAIKSINTSSGSYSDNRSININGAGSDIIDALKNRVGLSVAHGSYY